jgi:hypothetical protein
MSPEELRGVERLARQWAAEHPEPEARATYTEIARLAAERAYVRTGDRLMLQEAVDAAGFRVPEVSP